MNYIHNTTVLLIEGCPLFLEWPVLFHHARLNNTFPLARHTNARPDFFAYFLVISSNEHACRVMFSHMYVLLLSFFKRRRFERHLPFVFRFTKRTIIPRFFLGLVGSRCTVSMSFWDRGGSILCFAISFSLAIRSSFTLSLIP